MANLKRLFIKYLNDNYLNTFASDIEKIAKIDNSNILIVERQVNDISVLDSDDDEFKFRVQMLITFFSSKGQTSTFLSLEYKCILDEGMKDLQCLGLLRTYGRRFNYSEELSEHMIPYFSKERYDELARRFIKKYLEKDYELPIDYYSLIEKMNLDFIVDCNSEDVLGKIIFKESMLPISTSPENKTRMKRLKKGTIIVNIHNIVDTKNDYLMRSTVIHECLHWHFHRKAFEILMLINNNYSYLECKKYEEDNEMNKMFNLMEAQANGVAPCVVMEYGRVNDFYEESKMVVAEDPNTINLDVGKYISEVCKKVGENFGATLNATNKRLISLGYDEVQANLNKNNVYDFIPISTNEQLEQNESRCINREQFNQLLKNDDVLRFLITNKYYTYVNGYVVFNSNKYVIGSWPLIELTDEAKEHIDQCTLIFNVEWKYEGNANSFAYSLLQRSSGKSSCVVRMSEKSRDDIVLMMEQFGTEEQQKDFFESYKTNDNSDDFSDYLIYLMTKYELTINDLALKSGVSSQAIKKYRSYQYDDAELTKVLSLCAGIGCYPFESLQLIKKAGYDIENGSPKNKIYYELVIKHYKENIHKWNQILSVNGEKPLNNL